MDSQPTPFDTEAPLGDARAIIRRNPDDPSEVEMIEASWGSNPRFTDGIDYRFIRSEGKSFVSDRCLIPCSEFHMKAAGGKRYRVTLDSGNFFYLAGIWEPAMAGSPVCYRIITVYANSDISDYQERHGAIIHRRQVMQWLDATVPVEDLLSVQPAHTFFVEEIKSGRTGKRGGQRQFAF